MRKAWVQCHERLEVLTKPSPIVELWWLVGKDPCWGFRVQAAKDATIPGPCGGGQPYNGRESNHSERGAPGGVVMLLIRSVLFYFIVRST